MTSSGIGHGGIYQEKTGYFLMTQRHVIRDKSYFKFMVPGTNISNLNNNYLDQQETWQDYPTKSDNQSYDPNIRIRLRGAIEIQLNQAISSGKLTPLSTLTQEEGQTIKSGEKFACSMPDTGKLNIMSFKGFNTQNNLLEFNNESRYVCAGFSGLPLLVLDKHGELTPKSVGLLAQADKETAPFLEKDCGFDLVGVRPHWKLSQLSS